MQVIGEPVISGGVVTRQFEVEGHSGIVPGVVWTPEGASGPRPLVLVGHVAGGDKWTPHALWLVDRLVAPAGFALATIDMVGHGDRDGPRMTRPDHGPLTIDPAFLATLATLATLADTMEATTTDWNATVAALRGLDEIGNGPLGYWGVSMGTVFGLPLIAATPDVRCAVLGTMGTFGGAAPWARLAPEVECPVLFLVQKGDGLIRGRHAKELFRLLGSGRKKLRSSRGGHSDLSDDTFDRSAAFLRKHLA